MKQKKLMAVVSVALLLCAAVGGTLAWMTAQTPAVTNTFEAAEVEVTIGEDFTSEGKSNIKLTNSGDIPAYLRAAIIMNWEKDGKVVYDSTCPLPDLTALALGAEWKMINGYYYYTSEVASGDTTSSAIFTNTIAEPDSKPEGAHLQVTILAEGIQAMPENAIQEAWGVYPSNGWSTTAPTPPAESEGGGAR
ncbi:MAG: hypothetical protein IKB65_04345 [Ruminiclostridium sp.]|nr:hypothetical protein [Ruminiclostridium sp.]